MSSVRFVKMTESASSTATATSTAVTSGASLTENLAIAQISKHGVRSIRTNNTLPSAATSTNRQQQHNPQVVVASEAGSSQELLNDKKLADDGDATNAFLLKKEGPCYILPKITTQPPTRLLSPVQDFVNKAVTEKLESSDNTSCPRKYTAMIEGMRQKKDISLLYMMLLSFRTAGILHRISGHPAKHFYLLDSLMQLNPFDYRFAEQNKNHNGKATESWKHGFILHPYSIADAYFNLLLALVSANTVLLVPALVCSCHLYKFY